MFFPRDFHDDWPPGNLTFVRTGLPAQILDPTKFLVSLACRTWLLLEQFFSRENWGWNCVRLAASSRGYFSAGSYWVRHTLRLCVSAQVLWCCIASTSGLKSCAVVRTLQCAIPMERRLANTSTPLPMCPSCQIGDTDSISSLVIGSQAQIRSAVPLIWQ